MTFTLVHADANLSQECQNNMKLFIRYSLDNSKSIVGFFEQPLLNYETNNKEKLVKNIRNLINFFYNYIIYAEPILKKCRPDIYEKRFSEIKAHYNNFINKYIA